MMNDDWSLTPGQFRAGAQAASPIASSETIWHNTITGENIWARVNASGDVLEERLLMPTDESWQVAATGDFNRDGSVDVLWRHDQGSLFWWFLRDGKIIGSSQLNSVPDRDWQVIGVGDSNQDGQLDILWRHQPTGSNQWWLMPAVRSTSSGVLAPAAIQTLRAVADPNWVAMGTGDINRDGHPDILWTYRPTGFSLWWQMQQSDITGVSVLDSTIASTQQIQAIADVNGDGAIDLVLQDVTVDTSNLWLMQTPRSDGTIATVSQSVIVPRFQTRQAAGWQVVGIADMDAGNSLANATFEPSGIFTRAQSIGGSTDPADVYIFGLGTAGVLSASLTGLSADADIRLIHDRNANGLVDAGEVRAWQWERGSRSEQIEAFLEPGGYYLEVRSYDNQVTNYQLATRFEAMAEAPRQLDIQVRFDAANEPLDQLTIDAIESAAVFWEDALVGGGSLVPGGVLPITITTADLNLQNGLPDELTLAFAGPNVVSDGQQLFIQSGDVTLNRRRLDTLDAVDLRNLFIHEFSHVLGYGTLWEPLSFRFGDGSLRQIGVDGTANSLIDPNRNVYQANSYAGWAYGELLRDAGLAAQTIQTEVPIEAVFRAHWDEGIFQSEVLTPIADLGSSQPISMLSLAAMRDLGWELNFGAADPYQLSPPDLTATNIDVSNLAWPLAASQLDSTS